MTIALLLVVSLILTALFWIALPLSSTVFPASTNGRQWSIFVLAGAVALAGVSVFAAFSGPKTIILSGPLALGMVPFKLCFNPLADGILAVIAFTSAAGSSYLRGYMAHLASRVNMRLFWIAYSWLLASMAAVALAGNVQTFFIAWELMSLTSFLLVATDNVPRKTRGAALIYLAATRIGTAFLVGGFLWAHVITKSWDFADWHITGIAALGPGLLVLAGLGIKAGMWPFHLWLPMAHPAAPAPVSAVMSGVMVKVALVVLIRLFITQAAFISPAFGYVLIALGAVGAIWGILFALVQQDMKRMLALSTVENIGIILVGLGGSLVLGSLGLAWASRLALAGAIFHMVNHAVFKYLLFLGAGAIDTATGTRDLDLLGGICRKMPVTFACFLVGAASICALPPLSGFAGEWLLYQSAFCASWSAHTPLVRFAGLMAISCLALIGTLVTSCFIRTIGIAFQGRPRSAAAEKAHEVASGMRASQIILSCACVGLGLCAPWMLRLESFVIGQHFASGPPLSSAWTLPLGSAIFTVLVVAAAVTGWLINERSFDPARVYITWDCGFGDVGPRVQATSISFAQPVVRMFGTLFNYAHTLRLEGLDSRLFPDEVLSETTVDHPLEHHVYGPAVKWFDQLSHTIMEMQQGSIHIYLLTMLVTLALLLVIGGYLQ